LVVLVIGGERREKLKGANTPRIFPRKEENIYLPIYSERKEEVKEAARVDGRRI